MVRPPPVVTTCRGLAGREHTDQPPVEQGETSPASPLGRGLAGREHTDQPPVELCGDLTGRRHLSCRGVAGREHTDQPPVEHGETSPGVTTCRGLAGRKHTDQPPVELCGDLLQPAKTLKWRALISAAGNQDHRSATATHPRTWRRSCSPDVRYLYARTRLPAHACGAPATATAGDLRQATNGVARRSNNGGDPPHHSALG